MMTGMLLIDGWNHGGYCAFSFRPRSDYGGSTADGSWMSTTLTRQPPSATGLIDPPGAANQPCTFFSANFRHTPVSFYAGWTDPTAEPSFVTGRVTATRGAEERISSFGLSFFFFWRPFGLSFERRREPIFWTGNSAIWPSPEKNSGPLAIAFLVGILTSADTRPHFLSADLCSSRSTVIVSFSKHRFLLRMYPRGATFFRGFRSTWRLYTRIAKSVKMFLVVLSLLLASPIEERVRIKKS